MAISKWRGVVGLLLLMIASCGRSDDYLDEISRHLESRTMIPAGSTWLVSATSGDRGTTWRTLTYDASGWPSTVTPAGYGETYVQPIPYGPDPNHKPTTV